MLFAIRNPPTFKKLRSSNHQAFLLRLTVKEHGQQNLQANHLSPFTTIVCTQLRMRGEDKGKTYRALHDQFGLFKQEDREAQGKPNSETPSNLYPEYQSEYMLPKIGD